MQSQPAGVQLIVLYKFAKAGLQLTLGLALFAWLAAHGGETDGLREAALALEDHALHRFVRWLAGHVARAATPGHVQIVGLALLGDAGLSAVEGWALLRRKAWGPWLIVGATSLLVPFELLGLLHRMHPTRLLLLVANLVVVAYLVRHARGRHLTHLRLDEQT